MKIHRAATVTAAAYDAFALARYVESFAETSPDWVFPADKSAEYERGYGAPACCIVTASSDLPRAAIHLAVLKEGARSLTLTNIVPLDTYQLSIDEYNVVLGAFARALRLRGRQDAVSIKVALTRGDIRLADVVTGKVPWKYFQRYLGLHPLSGHPLDIERLDKFTCALSRYSRKHFDFTAFQCLLTEELGWSAEDASWCRSRVEVGLDVLAANRGFF